jgi:hypothetical protein
VITGNKSTEVTLKACIDITLLEFTAISAAVVTIINESFIFKLIDSFD